MSKPLKLPLREIGEKKRTLLENTNDSAVILLVMDHVGPDSSLAALIHRTVIPMTSCVEVFPNTFLKLAVFSSLGYASLSAQIFFESDLACPEVWSSFCPSLIMLCDKLVFGREGQNVTVEAIGKSVKFGQRLIMPFQMHNTRDIPGKASIFALSAYLHSARNLKQPDCYCSLDPFLARRGIKIAVGVEGKRLTLDLIREENKVEDEYENFWEQLRMWYSINAMVFRILRSIREEDENNLMFVVRATLLRFHGFVTSTT